MNDLVKIRAIKEIPVYFIENMPKYFFDWEQFEQKMLLAILISKLSREDISIMSMDNSISEESIIKLSLLCDSVHHVDHVVRFLMDDDSFHVEVMDYFSEDLCDLVSEFTGDDGDIHEYKAV